MLLAPGRCFTDHVILLRLQPERLDIERVHFRRAILDLEQVAPLVDGGGAPPNVYNRRRVRLES